RALGEYTRARLYCDEALRLHDELGNSAFGRSFMLYSLGLTCYYQGEHDVAYAHCQESLALARELGSQEYEARALYLQGHALLALGYPAEAAAAYRAAFDIQRALGHPNRWIDAAAGLASAALAQGEITRALEHVSQILSHLQHG